MNNILNIKLPFQSEKNQSKPGPRNLNKDRSITLSKIEKLILDLQKVLEFYSNENRFIKHCLVDVTYVDIISKSGRIQEIFKTSKKECNDLIVGARFTNSKPGFENHIITYYITRDCVQNAISKLKKAKSFIDGVLGGQATRENFDSKLSFAYSSYGLKEKEARDIIIDCSAIESFGIPSAFEINNLPETMIVTFYSTELSVSELLKELQIYDSYPVAKNTFSVTKETFRSLTDKVPYLISMVSSDISKIEPYSLSNTKKDNLHIHKPSNEPTIGVIDTLFDDSVYFKEWVDYHETLDLVEEKLENNTKDYTHGTSISSIIVDGPTLNPWLDDGCGNFKVRHFGVCREFIAPSRLVRKVEEIIKNNLDIHVWNISLGTEEEVSKNFVSFDSAELDDLQTRYDVIFVISGTNDNRNNKKDRLRIGSPADSLNSIVVNSVKRNNKPVSYARKGPVLSFFNKPDVSYYGGDTNEKIKVYSNIGIDEQYGTSLAAPWISRKLSFLIDIFGFSREVAKALILDSAANWSYKQKNYLDKDLIGYGVVPISIFDIINSKDDEIRFILTGVSSSYKTSNYSLPIPKDDLNKTPYIARATLCYFPKCNRLQGVDYTQRELSIKFGVVNDNGIKDINYNVQDEDGEFTNERKARKVFRKWENTKFISNLLTEKIKSKKLYNEGFYGISITSKERQTHASQNPLKFGVVITLKNIKGENRIEEFKHACLLRGYIVNEVQLKNKINIYNIAQEDIKFD